MALTVRPRNLWRRTGDCDGDGLNQVRFGQISSTDRGVRRIITDAATKRAAPTTANTKCHQLQLNCLLTATDELDADEHAS